MMMMMMDVSPEAPLHSYPLDILAHQIAFLLSTFSINLSNSLIAPTNHTTLYRTLIQGWNKNRQTFGK